MASQYQPQPSIRSYSQNQDQSSLSEEEQLARNLATSLSQVLRRSETFLLKDDSADEVYVVSVHKIANASDYKILPIVAGPAGKKCKCCDGRGIEK
jgi:hypothetical protein